MHVHVYVSICMYSLFRHIYIYIYIHIYKYIYIYMCACLCVHGRTPMHVLIHRHIHVRAPRRPCVEMYWCINVQARLPALLFSLCPTARRKPTNSTRTRCVRNRCVVHSTSNTDVHDSTSANGRNTTVVVWSWESSGFQHFVLELRNIRDDTW